MTRTLPLQTRLARIERRAESDTIEVVWSTGAEVRRYDWWEDRDVLEELDLSGADLSRLNAGAPVLDSHNMYQLANVIGVVERAWVEGNEGRAEIRFSDRPEVAGIRADVANGILRNLSIGYQIIEMQRERGINDAPDRVRVTRFQPYEISLVTVPADARAQIQQRDGSADEYPVNIIEDTQMTDENHHTDPAPDPDATPVEPLEISEGTDIDAIVAERVQRELAAARVREKAIRDLCRSVRLPDLADSLIEAGATLEHANAEIVKRWIETGGAEIRQNTTANHPSADATRLWGQIVARYQ
jgi:HK97 family phage prohead protease